MAERRTTSAGMTLEPPEEPEPLAMPVKEGLGFENQEGVLPRGKSAGEEQEGEAVAAGQAGFLDLALEDDHLLAKQGILEQEFGLGASQIEGEAEHEGGRR